MNDFGDLVFALVVLLIVVIVSMVSGQNGYNDGVCAERWKHTVSASDTVQMIKNDCKIPEDLTGK